MVWRLPLAPIRASCQKVYITGRQYWQGHLHCHPQPLRQLPLCLLQSFLCRRCYGLGLDLIRDPVSEYDPFNHFVGDPWFPTIWERQSKLQGLYSIKMDSSPRLILPNLNGSYYRFLFEFSTVATREALLRSNTASSCFARSL